MTKLSPSILSADFVNLERDIRALTEQGADFVRVDVMDGIFVPISPSAFPSLPPSARSPICRWMYT